MVGGFGEMVFVVWGWKKWNWGVVVIVERGGLGGTKCVGEFVNFVLFFDGLNYTYKNFIKIGDLNWGFERWLNLVEFIIC